MQTKKRFKQKNDDEKKMRTKKRCERKKMRTKKKMQTKKKEGNEFSLMKFVQMARVGFRNCHTRWFSKKKILGPVMYICS